MSRKNMNRIEITCIGQVTKRGYEFSHKSYVVASFQTVASFVEPEKAYWISKDKSKTDQMTLLYEGNAIKPPQEAFDEDDDGFDIGSSDVLPRRQNWDMACRVCIWKLNERARRLPLRDDVLQAVLTILKHEPGVGRDFAAFEHFYKSFAEHHPRGAVKT